ncbi:hypothetical protein [Pseudomonas sp. UBA6323]|uniref:hypothetical protein n=1 Tax=Pseudomonas sp. UBA6323 TaxID=1947329 RepID=UPI0025E6873E|nr:hypothetical protein [Pseudomonas sp. UBA6323]
MTADHFDFAEVKFTPDASGDYPFWYVSTPPINDGGVVIQQMIAPFPSEREAAVAQLLLREAYPNNTCYLGGGTYNGAEVTVDRLEQAARKARGDLAGLLAGIDTRGRP